MIRAIVLSLMSSLFLFLILGDAEIVIADAFGRSSIRLVLVGVAGVVAGVFISLLV